MLNVPVEKYSARMPTSMKALPNSVKMMNFMAEYSRRPLPQSEMRKYIGKSSSSQKMKNRTASMETNTPVTAVWSTNSQTKYSFTRTWMFQDAKAAHMPSSAVRSTRGTLSPSTPR